MSRIISVTPLGFPWQPPDPFLACMHHDDAYPAGNDVLGPQPSLAGRRIGMDFEGKDGWNMYHGDVVPGFPQHPHRGFETVTIARKGLIDHSDSLGAAARFGEGDVQWITAGKGIVHSEMFPLLDKNGGNHLELFQIWLNLPSEDKLAEPHFSMLWDRAIPRVVEGGAEFTVIAGALAGKTPPPPPPRSWGARADSDVAIWTIKAAPGARFTIPAAKQGTNRALFFFRGAMLKIDGDEVPGKRRIVVEPDAELHVENGPEPSEILLLQGKPIKQPVAQYGPFVMNNRAEIQQAFMDYERTKFGGWPWPSDGPVHPRDAVRWARWPDGHEERAG